MAQSLSNKYFVRKSADAAWEDVTTKFDGIKILSITGFNEEGDTVNVFTQQWVNTQGEDFHVAGDSVIRQNVDLSVTFIAATRYSANKDVDTQTVYDAFKNYISRNGDFYIRSAYTNKAAHVVCLKGFKPTTEKLHRGIDSYILATVTLHMLDTPSTI